MFRLWYKVGSCTHAEAISTCTLPAFREAPLKHSSDAPLTIPKQHYQAVRRCCALRKRGHSASVPRSLPYSSPEASRSADSGRPCMVAGIKNTHRV